MLCTNLYIDIDNLRHGGGEEGEQSHIRIEGKRVGLDRETTFICGDGIIGGNALGLHFDNGGGQYSLR